MRIAIIGAGVSGLTAAHLLDARHDVHVFEANGYAGGHTNTVPVETPDGVVPVDTGFIVLNDRTYPLFEALLADLGVATQPSHMGFSVSDGRDFEYAGTPRGLFARPRHLADPAFLRMVADYRRFNRTGERLMRGGGMDREISLGDWLDREGYSRLFVERLIVPQASAVWSADPAQMWSFPAHFLFRFFANHGMFRLTDRPTWRTVEGGSWSYVRALTSRLRNPVRTATPVSAITRRPDGVDVTAGGEVDRFDEVVIATHSDQALALLTDPDDAEREILGAIPYAPNEAVLHTDTRLMPRRRGAWASWNFHLAPEAPGATTVTYWMNKLQQLDTAEQYLVTLNRTDAIDPEKILRVVAYDHPVFTPAGYAAQERWSEISGTRRTHYCGAYWRWAFHEDGVWSAHRVAAALDAAAGRPIELVAAA